MITILRTTMPGLDALRKRIMNEFNEKLGEGVKLNELPDLLHLGLVDDFYGSFEWSDGGILHAHIAFWMVGAPRIDKIQVPHERDESDSVLHETWCGGENPTPPSARARDVRPSKKATIP